MRHLFLDKPLRVVPEIAQSVLDEDTVLLTMHHTYTTQSHIVDSLENLHARQTQSIPHKIKTILMRSNSKKQIVAHYPVVGQIVAIGKQVRSLQPGDWAVTMPGVENHNFLVRASQMLTFKVTQDHALPALFTPLVARALYAINRSNAQPGDWVVVYGVGILAKLIIQLLSRMGCRVIVVTKHQSEKGALKAYTDYFFDPMESQVTQEIQLVTQGNGVQATFVACPSGSLGFVSDITRSDGTIVLLGHYLNLQTFDSEHAVVFAHEGVLPDYYQRPALQKALSNALYLLTHNKLEVEFLLEHQYTIGQTNSAKESEQTNRIIDRRRGCVINIQPLPQGKKLKSKPEFSVIPAVKDTIRVGLIGDKLEQSDILSYLLKERTISINAIASDTVTLKKGQFYGAQLASADDQALLSSENLDAIVVCSTQRNQTEYALQALRSNKALFMTTPLVTKPEQWIQFKEILSNQPVRLGVNFYRTASPFIQKIMRVMQDRKTPLMAQYRVNNAATKDCIVQGVGVGRIMNDAAHIIDLFCSLVGTQPYALSVEGVRTEHAGIFPTDNFSLQLTFEDGSICSILYTVLGHSSLHEERLELFFDRKTIILDDYRTLHGFGLPSWFNETTSQPDMGKQQVIEQFFSRLKTNPITPPEQLVRLKTVAHLCLIADQLVCQGGGSSTELDL